jgi:hypothetical protein
VRRRKTPKRKLKDYLDGLWSRLTKEIHGKVCVWCGKVEGLQSDHIISRSYSQTRWRIENAVILCGGCHIFRKKRDPYGWAQMVNKVRGVDTVEALRKQSLRTDKVDFEEVQKYLETLDREKAWESGVFGRKA